jgi:aspartyl-tRNA(Asn)/glutamyl-tRNA(Gln) amidotransferase subunit C
MQLGSANVSDEDESLRERRSAISRDEVARLAKLARLALTDAELDSFAGQLDAILGYVSNVQSVDVTDVAPTGNPLADVNVSRPDVVEDCLTQEQALAEAPATEDGRFAVPRILGEPE